jgi:oligoribonuclease NrnB/cAMP/cGMP phosphodiesterase (DHH superfamily)
MKTKLRSELQRKYLITHTDLDGIGCAVIMKKCFPNLVIIHTEYADVNRIVNQLLDTGTEDEIYITDMSVDEITAERLNKRGRVNLIDHHGTAKWLAERYNWALVDTKYAGTKLVYDMLSTRFEIRDYEEFVNVVDNYDTWGHGTEPEQHSKDMSRLLYLLGREAFIARMDAKSDINFLPGELLLLECDNQWEKQYQEDSIKITEVQKDGQGYLYGILYADRYQSTLGHYILDQVKELEYVIMLDPRNSKVGLRGRGNVDLGAMAKAVGGGGHAKAAGFPLTTGTVQIVTACYGNCEVVQKLRGELNENRSGLPRHE